MTRHLDLGDMMMELIKVEAAELLAMEVGLEKVAQLVEKTAKSEFGAYQPGIGDFPAWQELADSTKADRVQQGFTENDPLLRSGEQRDGIEHETRGLEAVIGSAEEVMLYLEVGTSKMPPRPVLGPAAMRNIEQFKVLAAASVLAGFGGGSLDFGAEGYALGIDKK